MDEWTGSEVGAGSEEWWAESEKWWAGSEEWWVESGSGSGLLIVERRERVESADMT